MQSETKTGLGMSQFSFRNIQQTAASNLGAGDSQGDGESRSYEASYEQNDSGKF